MKVQLLTFPGCPNADFARERLKKVLQRLSLKVAVEEVDTTATPDASLRRWGSPTILIDGHDVAHSRPDGGRSCRLYADGGPSEADIESAVNASLQTSP